MENFVINGREWMRTLLDFRNWLYEIRQQEQQYVPKAHAGKDVKFGPFLLKTRQEMLQRLLKIQEEVPIGLITRDELDCIEKMLDRDSEGHGNGMLRRFVLELWNGKRLALFSDFDILKTARTRLGPFVLKGAKVIRSRKISANFPRSTRLMYHTA